MNSSKQKELVSLWLAQEKSVKTNTNEEKVFFNEIKLEICEELEGGKDWPDAKREWGPKLNNKIPIFRENVKFRPYERQIEFLQDMSFISAVGLLPQFNRMVSMIRKEWEIIPNKMLKKLGLTAAEIDLATYTANPDQVDALLRASGEDVRKRRKLAIKKLKFENEFLLKQAQEIDSKISIWFMSFYFKIPKFQMPHIINYVLYDLKTGTILSLYSGGSRELREWKKRLLRQNESNGIVYNSFLKKWLFYLIYKFRAEGYRKANKILEELGFPPVKKKDGPKIVSRYEKLFIKERR